MSDYAATADRLALIIKDMIPEHPEIMEIDNAFALFKVEGFKEAMGGLEPSLAQADWALKRAQHLAKELTDLDKLKALLDSWPLSYCEAFFPATNRDKLLLPPTEPFISIDIDSGDNYVSFRFTPDGKYEDMHGGSL